MSSLLQPQQAFLKVLQNIRKKSGWKESFGNCIPGDSIGNLCKNLSLLMKQEKGKGPKGMGHQSLLRQQREEDSGREKG
jgi:hypothetical protein